jgi:transcriptional regulator of acetoin/glycerol metabolism
MAKAPFTPDDHQKKLLAAVKRAAKKKEAADAEYKEALAQCAQANIPVLRLSEELGVERKTIYRHLGRSMT